MKERLEQINHLLAEDKLVESAEMLKKCEQTIKGKKRKGNFAQVISLNKNTNAARNKRGRLTFNQPRGGMLSGSQSIDTIYDTALLKRNSSSSEDEYNEVSFLNHGSPTMPSQEPDAIDKQIQIVIAEARRATLNTEGDDEVQFNNQGSRPSPGPSATPMRRQEQQLDMDMTVREQAPRMQPRGSSGQFRQAADFETLEERVQDMVRQAEAAKAKLFTTPGKHILSNASQFLSPSAVIDEGYFVVGAHLDDSMIEKIGKGEYVDFGKLLPKDKVLAEDDCRFEMILKNGRTFWCLVGNSVNINSYAKWEQAFRVFSNIYCKANPHRSVELIAYNNVIHTIALAYSWENVYTHDKEFWLHMARFPQRSWAMILQQAWSLRLHDRISAGNWSGPSGASNHNNNNRTKINEPCHRFNRGKCNFGSSCKYEHKCTYYFKFGHSVLNCCKAAADRGVSNSGGKW